MPQLLLVDLADVRQPAAPEHVEERLVIELPDSRQLEVEKGVLADVQIDGVNVRGPLQGIIQRIAARRGNDQDPIERPQIERLAVEARVFPAGVVNQVPPMDEPEPGAIQPFVQSHGTLILF